MISRPHRTEKIEFSFLIIDHYPTLFKKFVSQHAIDMHLEGRIDFIQAGQQCIHLVGMLAPAFNIMEYTSEYFHFIFTYAKEIYPFDDVEIVQHSSVNFSIYQVEFRT